MPTLGSPERVAELCRWMYSRGWATGTGGGISIRDDQGIHVAPSGVQKEYIEAEDVFLLDGQSLDRPKILRPAADSTLRVSECTPLFLNAYRMRAAGACLHSHSLWAVLAARLASPSGAPGHFTCEGWEMQKGLRARGCFETIVVPILANTPRESALSDTMAAAMAAHPEVDAILVAGHGLYVWGADWIQAKTQAECLDYLFRATVEAHRLGLPR